MRRGMRIGEIHSEDERWVRMPVLLFYELKECSVLHAYIRCSLQSL